MKLIKVSLLQSFKTKKSCYICLNLSIFNPGVANKFGSLIRLGLLKNID